MKRVLLYIVLAGCVASFTYADECSDWLNDANSAFNQQQWDKAKHYYNLIKNHNCGYNVSDRIRQCDEHLNPSSQSVSQESQISTTSPANAPAKNSSSSKSASSSAPAPYLSLSKTSITASQYSTNEYITVSSNRDWIIQFGNGSWYSATRSGNTIKVIINQNNGERRQDFFNVNTTDGSKSVQVRISQAPAATQSSSSTSSSNSSSASIAYLSLSKMAITASAAGTTEYITITTNRKWEIQHPTGAMYSVSRYSDNMVKVVISKNTTGTSRSDYFKIRTTDGSKTVKVSLSQGVGSSSTSSSNYSSSSYSNSSYSNTSKYRTRSSYSGVVQDWYSNAGRIECSWWSPKVFVGSNWGYEQSMIDCRFWLFEISPAVIGVKLTYRLDYQVYYAPKIKAYIPMTDTWSMSMAIGPNIGISGLSSKNSLFKDLWLNAEIAFRCHHRNSAVNTDLFMRYNDGIAVGVAWSFTKAWGAR